MTELNYHWLLINSFWKGKLLEVVYGLPEISGNTEYWKFFPFVETRKDTHSFFSSDAVQMTRNNEIGNCLRDNRESHFHGVKCCGNHLCFLPLLIYLSMNTLCFMELSDTCVNSKNVLPSTGLDVLLRPDRKVVWTGGIALLLRKANFPFTKYPSSSRISLSTTPLNMYGGGSRVSSVAGSLPYFL